MPIRSHIKSGGMVTGWVNESMLSSLKYHGSAVVANSNSDMEI